MINELEKTFFDTFGIEPKEFKSCDVGTFCPYPEKECGTDTCPYYRTYKVDYPAIIASILLELIIISGTICTVFDKNVDDLKENVLKNLIELSGRYHIYNQVRTLFEEG